MWDGIQVSELWGGRSLVLREHSLVLELGEGVSRLLPLSHCGDWMGHIE